MFILFLFKKKKQKALISQSIHFFSASKEGTTPVGWCGLFLLRLEAVRCSPAKRSRMVVVIFSGWIDDWLLPKMPLNVANIRSMFALFRVTTNAHPRKVLKGSNFLSEYHSVRSSPKWKGDVWDSLQMLSALDPICSHTSGLVWSLKTWKVFSNLIWKHVEKQRKEVS